MYINAPFNSFFNDLASKKSSPGGGSVAAITGLHAISLVIMQAQLTINKKGYEKVQSKINEIINKSIPLQKAFTRKIDEDVLIFQNIMKCYKLPKENRNSPLKSALLKSASFSIEMAEEALKTLELAILIGSIGNKMLKSDAYIALLNANTCIESAFANVHINIEGINDENIHKDFINKIYNIHTKAKKIMKNGYSLFKNYRKGIIETE